MEIFLAVLLGVLALEASVEFGIAIWKELRELIHRPGKGLGGNEPVGETQNGWQSGFDEMMKYDIGTAIKAARRQMDNEDR